MHIRDIEPPARRPASSATSIAIQVLITHTANVIAPRVEKEFWSSGRASASCMAAPVACLPFADSPVTLAGRSSVSLSLDTEVGADFGADD